MNKRKKLDAIIRAVWVNERPKRYLPRAYSTAGTGWGIFDTKAGKFVDGDKAVLAIDPDEILVN